MTSFLGLLPSLPSPPQNTTLVPRFQSVNSCLEHFHIRTRFYCFGKAFAAFACKMAVIDRCESGFLVDHKKSISETVSSLSLSCKETLFGLYEPYFRSSSENSSDTKGTRKRKVRLWKRNKFIPLMKISNTWNCEITTIVRHFWKTQYKNIWGSLRTVINPGMFNR